MYLYIRMCKDFRSDSYPHGSHDRRKCGELSWWCLPGKTHSKMIAQWRSVGI